MSRTKEELLEKVGPLRKSLSEGRRMIHLNYPSEEGVSLEWVEDMRTFLSMLKTGWYPAEWVREAVESEKTVNQIKEEYLETLPKEQADLARGN
jgi:hypothetical protein